jgi:hypothetical protein
MKKCPSSDPTIIEWFGKQTSKPENVNPCVRLYGLREPPAKCKACALLFSHCTARKWYKCKLRGCTHGPGTDHRVNWPACARFVAKVQSQ